MSAAAAILNVVLVLLLLAALAFGWRLERRLKALKDSHESFVKSVADLDASAARAEQSLADLRAFTDEASDTLAARIESARALAAQLEQGVVASSTRPVRSDAVVTERPEPKRVPAARSEPATTPRSRARVDDDLFEPDADAGRLRAIGGGRP
ncbi:MAG: DUF6468 domain-containing protein [Pseudomonadota bacterium]